MKAFLAIRNRYFFLALLCVVVVDFLLIRLVRDLHLPIVDEAIYGKTNVLMVAIVGLWLFQKTIITYQHKQYFFFGLLALCWLSNLIKVVQFMLAQL